MNLKKYAFLCTLALTSKSLGAAASSTDRKLYSMGELKKSAGITPKLKSQTKEFLIALKAGLKSQEDLLALSEKIVTLTDIIESKRIRHNEIVKKFQTPDFPLRIEGGGHLKGRTVFLSSKVFSLIHRYPILYELQVTSDPNTFTKRHYQAIKTILDTAKESVRDNEILKSYIELTELRNESIKLELERLVTAYLPANEITKKILALKQSKCCTPFFDPQKGPLKFSEEIGNALHNFVEIAESGKSNDESFLFRLTPEDEYFINEQKRISTEYAAVKPELERLKEITENELNHNKVTSESFIPHLPAIKKGPQKKAPISKRTQHNTVPTQTTTISGGSSSEQTQTPVTTEFAPAQDLSASSVAQDIVNEATYIAQGASSSSSSSSEQSPSSEIYEDDTLVTFPTNDGKRITVFKVDVPQHQILTPKYSDYTRTIKQWLADPEKELDRQIEDPNISPSKRSKLIENRAVSIFMHAFPTTVETLFDKASTILTTKDRRTGDPIKIVTMFGAIEDSTGASRFLVFQWLFNKDNICFHREASEVTPSELFRRITSSKNSAPAYFDIPELYQEEFPGLGKAKR
jgi:hypothetical protein